MNPKKLGDKVDADEKSRRIFSVLFGLFLGLALVKFGNVCLIEAWKPTAVNQWLAATDSGSQTLVEWPANGWEWALDSWPLVIGQSLLIGLVVFGLFVARRKITAPKWLVALPLVWLVWQFISATHTVDAALTGVTLKHFSTCVACFYLGLFCLNGSKNLTGFWLGLLLGFVWVITAGLFQHFGGLEATRNHFWLYIYPELPHPAPELLKRMSSNRIFSTLFYPNALAGALLLCLPALLCFVWRLERQFTFGARILLTALIGLPALGCLFWSGSKGGWLLMLVLGLVALLSLKFERKWKIALVALVLVCGLTGFAVRFSGYFKKGATSVGARFDYWRAAIQTTVKNPLRGSGPGTFAIPYSQIKKSEAEMARLTHNDYLQQASDSGLPAFLAYTCFVWVSLIWCIRSGVLRDGQFFAVWLGILGWALQSLMEFGLYIPALSWLAFALIGWLLGPSGNQFDKPKSAVYSSVQ